MRKKERKIGSDYSHARVITMRTSIEDNLTDETNPSHGEKVHYRGSELGCL